jgi:thymidylate synthase
MIAQVCDLAVGEFIHTIGDSHIYVNQLDGVKEQLTRAPGKLPTLWINPEIKDITKFSIEDFRLENYYPQESIKFPFAT